MMARTADPISWRRDMDPEYTGFYPRPADNLFFRNPELVYRQGHNRHRQSLGPPCGKYRPFLCGRFVFGPYKWILFPTILGFLAVGLLMLYQHTAFTLSIGATWASIGFALLPVTIFMLCWTSLTDPGVIPRHGDIDERWWGLPNYRKDVKNGYRDWLCGKCSSIRPARTYHCDVCRICIRRQDMHLYIGGTCIGERNFAQYFILNFFQVLLGAYLIAANSYLFVTLSENPGGFEPTEFYANYGSMICGFVFLMAPQTGLPIFAYRFFLLANDRSLREECIYVARILRGNRNQPTYITRKNVILNTFSALIFWRKGSSWFRMRDTFNNRDERYVDVPPETPSESSDDFTSFRGRFGPIRHYRNKRDFFHGRSSGPQRDLSINLQEVAKSKVNPNGNSVPNLDCGELFSLPGDRIRRSRDRRAIINLERRLRRFREVQQLPKSFIDLHQNTLRSLSEGSIPRTLMTSDHVNEMMQEARAIQIQRVIQFVLNADRRNIIRMSQRIDMGGILGIQHVENDDDPPSQALFNHRDPARRTGFQRRGIQPIELARIPRAPQNLPAGVPQMVAAGLLPRLQARMAHHLSPHHMNLLRSQYHQFDNPLYQSWAEPYYVPGMEPANPASQISPEQDRQTASRDRDWIRLRRHRARRPGRIPAAPFEREDRGPLTRSPENIPLLSIQNAPRNLEINNNSQSLLSNVTGSRGRPSSNLGRTYFRGSRHPLNPFSDPDPDPEEQ